MKFNFYNGLFLSFLVFKLIPTMYLNIIINIITLVLGVAALFVLIIKAYRPSSLGKAILLYFIYFLIISIPNITGYEYVRFLGNIGLNLVLLLYFDYLLQYKYFSIVKISLRPYLILSILAIISILAFPDGMYQSITFFKDGYYSAPVWILGHKNSHILVFLLGITYLWLSSAYRNNNKFLSYCFMTIISFLMYIVLYIIESSTAFVIMIIMNIAMLAFYILSPQTLKRFNIKICFAFYCLSMLAILTGATDIFAGFVEGFIGKSLTFTGRTDIWAQVMVYVRQNILFGSGLIDSATAISLLNNAAFTSAHNQYMDILWKGGLVGLVLFGYILYILINTIQHCKDIQIRYLASVIVLLYLIALMMESRITTLEVYLCFLIMYQACIQANLQMAK